MPWVHLHVENNGLVKACCEANIVYGNINKESISEIWQNESIKQFRQSLLSGNRDKRCASCFKKEDAGKKSMRIETLEKFSHHLEWVEQTKNDGFSQESKPIYFDIRFNNICNLKCRTCWHGASSSWFEEAKILRNNWGKKAIIEINDSRSLIKQVLATKAVIEEIYFAGGEPLMMIEHFQLLEGLLKEGLTNVHLRYNTNLSLLKLKDQSALELWKNFQKVTISASIDGLGDQAEYIRKGLNFNHFVGNMIEIKSKVPHVLLEIAPTVSIFNIFSLGQLHRYFVEKDIIQINDIYLNILSRPDQYNIKIWPQQAKKLIENNLLNHIEWIKEMNGSTETVNEFQALIDFMNMEDMSHLLPRLKIQLDTMDKLRSESYQELFKEINWVLDPV